MYRYFSFDASDDLVFQGEAASLLPVGFLQGTLISSPALGVARNEGEDDLPADTSTTGQLEPGVDFRGDLGTDDDVDWVALDVEAGQSYIIDAVAAFDGRDSEDLDVFLQLFDAQGNLIDENDDITPFDTSAELFYTAESDGTVYVAVSRSPNQEPDA